MSSPEEDRLRAALCEAHGSEALPPFHRFLVRRRRPVRPLAALVAVPALAMALAVCSTLLGRSRAPGPSGVSPAALSALGEMPSPLDFLLEPPGGDPLAGVPSFDLSNPSQEPQELTKGLLP